MKFWKWYIFRMRTEYGAFQSKYLYSVEIRENTDQEILRIWKFLTQRTLWNLKFEIRICDDAVLEIYLDHKFQWPQEGFNFESLAREVVNWWPSGLDNYFACKRFAVQTFLWSLEFEIQ